MGCVSIKVTPSAGHIRLPQTHCQLFKATYINNHVSIDNHLSWHKYTPASTLTVSLPLSKRGCNFHSCGQISLFLLSCGSLIQPREKHCCSIHSCSRFGWLAQRRAYFSRRPPAGVLLLATNHQELIWKWMLPTCQEWNFKHNKSGTNVIAMVDICQNKTHNRRIKNDKKDFYVFS